MNSSTRIIPMLFSGSREYRWTAANKMKKQKTPGADRIALHLGIAEKQNKSSGKLKEIKSCGQEAHKRLEKSTSCYPIMGQNMGQEVLCRNTKFLSKLLSHKSKRKSPEIVRFQGFLWLRRQDSNLRPPGYDPDELPTALLRDIQMRTPWVLRYYSTTHICCQVSIFRGVGVTL